MTPPQRTGRPHKLTGALRERLRRLIRSGVSQDRAARMAGIHPDTLGRWKNDVPGFAGELEAARAESSGFLEKLIALAARRDWKAAAWILERRHPAEFGRPGVRVEATASISLEEVLSDIEQRKAGAGVGEPPSAPLTKHPVGKSPPAQPNGGTVRLALALEDMIER